MLDKFDLICVVNWICWVFLLDSVCVEWLSVKYVSFIFCKNDNWLWIFFKIGLVIMRFCFDKFNLLKKLSFLLMVKLEIILICLLLILIDRVL